ncbi:uncharacterized protein LOC110831671 [Zootermopsis nevadensis]|nr:uncharacterized protein LOC110831671 [Zootermopsis nevadensis]
MWAGPRRKISDSLLVPSRSRPTSRLRTQHSCPESTCSHNYRVQDGQAHIHPPFLHSSTVYYPPLAHQSSVTAAPAMTAPAPPLANHLSCHCHSEQLELLNQKLSAAEEAKQRLLKENEFLLRQLEDAYRELHSLRDHVGEVRQQTVAFILRQMETLHIQKDTHV